MSPVPSKTRDNIVEAAMELFAFNGYGNTGLSEIAKKAGAQTGSIYHFFATKEELLAAVLQRRKLLLWPCVLTPVWDAVDDPIERIFKLLDQYRQMLIITEFSHGCPIGNLAIELCETHPNTRRLLVENFDNWLSGVQQCFTDAATRLPPDADPKRLAIFVLTTMEGAVMLARTYRDFSAYDAAVASLREYIDALVKSETQWGGGGGGGGGGGAAGTTKSASVTTKPAKPTPAPRSRHTRTRRPRK